MRRKLYMLMALIGCIVTDLRSCRCTWREIRESGLCEYFQMRGVMIRLIANVGGIQAQKMARMICAIVLEHAPRPELVRFALRFAADATHPSQGKTPAQIVAVVHRFARNVADEQAKLNAKGVHCV